MNPVIISAVSYLNTFPFVFGIKTSGLLDDIELQLDVPSVCAEKLKSGEAAIALIPTGALPDLENPCLVSDYCIGATGEVKTVLLLSRKPLEEIRTIALDFDSRTSIELVKVLARHFWKINPGWRNLERGEADHPAGIESLVAIGDKTLELAADFPFVYDLAGEWARYTSLPFVFAVWATIDPLPEAFLTSFNQALCYGIEHKHEVPDFFRGQIPPGFDILDYLERNISFIFDEKKRQGLETFLHLRRG